MSRPSDGTGVTGAVWEDWERPADADDGGVSPATLLCIYVREFFALLASALEYLYLIIRW